jgi:hypothetical protein
MEGIAGAERCGVFYSTYYTYLRSNKAFYSRSATICTFPTCQGQGQVKSGRPCRIGHYDFWLWKIVWHSHFNTIIWKTVSKRSVWDVRKRFYHRMFRDDHTRDRNYDSHSLCSCETKFLSLVWDKLVSEHPMVEPLILTSHAWDTVWDDLKR